MQTKETEATARSSSVELLRIIAMIAIVICHFATHGGFAFDEAKLTLPRLWWSFIEMGGNFGVNVFVLISGYFLVAGSGRIFNFKRVFKFWWQVFFYSIIIYAIFSAVSSSEFDIISCIKAFFPITFGLWWFASTYFVLYLIHPFLNMLILNLDKKTYQILITAQLILWCIIPTLTHSSYQSNNLIWFITLYSVAGYVRLYGLNPKFTAKSYIGFFLLFSSLRFLSCVVIMAIGTAVPPISKYSLFFYGQQSIFTFLSAFCLFLAFEKWDIGSVKWINIIASATFGVYLIHDHPLIRSLLWKTVFVNAEYQESALIIPYSIAATLIVYIACTLTDLVRKAIIERPLTSFIDRHAEQITKPFEWAIDKLKGWIFGK